MPRAPLQRQKLAGPALICINGPLVTSIVAEKQPRLTAFILSSICTETWLGHLAPTSPSASKPVAIRHFQASTATRFLGIVDCYGCFFSNCTNVILSPMNLLCGVEVSLRLLEYALAVTLAGANLLTFETLGVAVYDVLQGHLASCRLLSSATRVSDCPPIPDASSVLIKERNFIIHIDPKPPYHALHLLQWYVQLSGDSQLDYISQSTFHTRFMVTDVPSRSFIAKHHLSAGMAWPQINNAVGLMRGYVAVLSTYAIILSWCDYVGMVLLYVAVCVLLAALFLCCRVYLFRPNAAGSP
nr:unnamed protein product [Spirometra erinaceieuropaei]